MEQLSWTDALLYRAESRSTPVHINAVTIYDPSTAPGGKVRFTGILKAVESRLHITPTFRRRLVDVPLGLSAPYWVDDPDFDLEYHVRHIALPKPGDWRQLCIQLARLHARQIDMSRAPWEMTVIEGLDNVDGIPPGCFAISMKVHHAALDGVSGAEMLSALHDLTADGTRPAATEEWQGEKMPSGASLLRRTAWSAARHPLRAAKVAVEVAPELVRMGGSQLFGSSDGDGLDMPVTRFQDPVSAHRVVDGRFYDFETVRRIKRAVEGATVNDVVLAHVGGALRRYLQAHGELPEASLVAACPVSIRGPEQAGSGGNLISAARQALGTDIEDPMERLVEISRVGSEQRAERDGVSAPALLEVAELMPGLLIGTAARALAKYPSVGPTIANVVVTNVPGSPVPMYFAGAKVVRLFGLGPIFGGLGLIHIVGTYNGEYCVSITGDREQLPDPGFYAECLDDSFDELAKATA